jgi:hypothetical protein
MEGFSKKKRMSFDYLEYTRLKDRRQAKEYLTTTISQYDGEMSYKLALLYADMSHEYYDIVVRNEFMTNAYKKGYIKAFKFLYLYKWCDFNTRNSIKPFVHEFEQIDPLFCFENNSSLKEKLLEAVKNDDERALSVYARRHYSNREQKDKYWTTLFRSAELGYLRSMIMIMLATGIPMNIRILNYKRAVDYGLICTKQPKEFETYKETKARILTLCFLWINPCCEKNITKKIAKMVWETCGEDCWLILP